MLFMKFIKLTFILTIISNEVTEASLRTKNRDLINCKTPNDQEGKCVYLTRCENLFRKVLNNKLVDEEKQILRQSYCGFRHEQPLVCCENQFTQIIPNPAVFTRNSGQLFPEPELCRVKPSFKIVGGTNATIDEFPWTALIVYKNQFNHISFQCNAVLINNRHVLTAAHCVSGKILTHWTPTAVRLGEWNLKTNLDCIIDDDDFDCADPHIDIAIEKLFIHENYMPHSKNQYHDIAIIRMQEAVTFTEFIQPICLPFSDNLRKTDFSKLKFYISGWGKTEFAHRSNIKQKVVVPGFDTQECRRKYKGEHIFIISNQLCAGAVAGKDSCLGDSGAPLMTIDTSNRRLSYWYLVGLVSFGASPCGMEGWPAVYTKITEYLDWIEVHVNF